MSNQSNLQSTKSIAEMRKNGLNRETLERIAAEVLIRRKSYAMSVGRAHAIREPSRILELQDRLKEWLQQLR